MNGAIFHTVGHQAIDFPIRSLEQIERDIFNKEIGLVAQTLLVERVQHGMAGTVSGSTGAVSYSFMIFKVLPAKRPLVDLAIIGSREWQARVLKFDYRRDCLLGHVLDRILITKPVSPLHRIEKVVAPVILNHVAERRIDTPLGRHGMRTGWKHFGNTSHRHPGGSHAESGA